MEEDSNRKLQIFTYIYKHKFGKVKHVLRDLSLSFELNNKVIDDYTTNLEFEKFRKTCEVGAEFNFLWKKLITLYMRTLEYTESDNYLKVKWIIYKTNPPTPDYYLTYNLYADISGELTTFVMEWQYIVDLNVIDSTEISKERIAIFQSYDNFMSSLENERLQEERIFLKSDMKSAWTLIMNMKQLREYIPQLCDSV